MRRPNLRSRTDLRRIRGKLADALRGAVAVGLSADGRPHERVDNQGKSGGVGARSPGQATDAQGADGSLSVLTPLLIPLPSFRWVRAFNGWLCRRLAERSARRLGFENPTLINYVVVLAESMRGWQGRTVYHCVDRWDAFGMYNAELMARMDRLCCEYADVVIVSSRDLEGRCRQYHDRVHLISHGVDHAHFARALTAPERPADLPAGTIIGFFGLLSEWLDQQLLLLLSRELSEAHLVLIGRADVPIDALVGQPNIHILGPKPFATLPAYVAHFDVGIVPFVVNDLTRAVNPIKLREMLAAGCPVVSTALPEVEALAALRAGENVPVTIAGSHRAFVTAVGDRVRNPVPAAGREAISACVSEQTWAAKVDILLDVLASVPSRKALKA